MKASETAVILIEFQNDFCRENGKLHGLVRDEMIRVNTVTNAKRLLDAARAKGCAVVHCPFSLDTIWVDHCVICGLIANVRQGNVFEPGTWGHEIIPDIATDLRRNRSAKQTRLERFHKYLSRRHLEEKECPQSDRRRLFDERMRPGDGVVCV